MPSTLLSSKQKARELSFAFTNIYEEAIMTEVAEGKLSEEEAILKIREYKDASDFIKEAMAKADFHILTGQPEANLADGKQAALGAFYFISVCFWIISGRVILWILRCFLFWQGFCSVVFICCLRFPWICCIKILVQLLER